MEEVIESCAAGSGGQGMAEQRFGFRVDLKRRADFVSRADVLDLLQTVAMLGQINERLSRHRYTHTHTHIHTTVVAAWFILGLEFGMKSDRLAL